MKYKIAVVDDEPEYINRIKDLLNGCSAASKEELSFEINEFTTGDELLKNSPNSFEIIFLDINMPGTNGLRVAKRVRDQNKTAIIIFCTHYAQYAINGYEVNALGYILKPIEEVSFKHNFDRAMKLLKNSQSRRIRLKTLHGVEIMPVSDIVYLEIQIHNLYYYVLKDDTIIDYRTRGSMSEMTNNLGELGFARCSACYLVNLRHVVSVNNGEVRLHGGVVLPISRKFLRSFTDSFMKFLGKNGTLNV